MTTRRELLVALAAGTLAMPFRSLAQPQARVYRIGILAPDSLETRRPLIDIFIRAMHELGYVKGAKPADLPVERPTKFEFIVNMKPPKNLVSNSPTRFLRAPTG